jgi:hypothetical protein
VISAKDSTPAPASHAGEDATGRDANPGGRGRPRASGKSGERPAGADVGEALRAVYHEAVAEDVPDEMLDLLNKLG